jgi:peroxiredoxin family protein
MSVVPSLKEDSNADHGILVVSLPLEMVMKLLLVTVCAALSAGCGVEVATTAATTAAMKKQEVEAAQQTKALAQKKIDDATQAMQKNAEQLSNADK